MMAVNVVEAAASNIRAARAHASQIRAGLASLAADIRAAESDPALLGYDSWHEYAVDLFGVDKAEVLSIVRERCWRHESV